LKSEHVKVETTLKMSLSV